jgi:hypothetical protein
VVHARQGGGERKRREIRGDDGDGRCGKREKYGQRKKSGTMNEVGCQDGGKFQGGV